MKKSDENTLLLVATVIGVVGTIILVQKASAAQTAVSQIQGKVNAAYAQAQQAEQNVNYAATNPLATVWHEVEAWFGAGPNAQPSPSYSQPSYGGYQ